LSLLTESHDKNDKGSAAVDPGGSIGAIVPALG
jgi:hypothetical protein